MLQVCLSDGRVYVTSYYVVEQFDSDHMVQSDDLIL